MRVKNKHKLALWLSILLVVALVFPAIGTIDLTARAADDPTQSSLTVQAEVDKGSESVGQAVYSNACTPIVATTQPVWQSILKPTMTAGKVTFTIPDEYCSIELSFTSYAFQGNIQPDYMGRPYNKQYVFDNKTATYGPGTHTVEIDMPCGYWQIDLYSGPLIESVPYGHPAALLIKALVNYQDNNCPPDPEPPSLDLIDVTVMCVNTTGTARFELNNRNDSDVTLEYALADQSGQVTLGANETKVIEIVSNSSELLKLSLNGETRDTVAPNPANCNPGPEPQPSVERIDAAAMCVNVPGVVRFQLTNRNEMAAEVTYTLGGIVNQVTLTAGESRTVEIASASTELLKVAVNGVSKETVAADRTSCNPGPGPQPSVEQIDAVAMCVEEPGIVRFQLTNGNDMAAEVTYTLGGISDQVTLAAGESRTVEIASASTELLTVTVNGVSKETVAADPTSCNPGPVSTVALINASAMCVNQTGIVRFALTNQNSTVTEVTYSLKGVSGQVTIPANGETIIQLAAPADGELLKVAVGGESKDTVAPSATLCGSTGGGEGGGSEGGGDDDDTIVIVEPPVPTGPPATQPPGTTPPGGTNPGTSTPGTTPPVPSVPDTEVTLPEDSGVPRGPGQPSEEQPAESDPAAVIEDAEIPLGYPSLPQTGEKTPWAYYGIGALLIAAGIVSGLKRRRTGL
ncbi:LPXTG-motif cell wall anchor domain-containing protein [Paenibacillus sp. UNCCL117]|uniref:LPXTG cell wall anchor domain-containing protein n=1 Tax=unclassified Paenibacillus TaxID=185978 RepID=UPI0008899B42|nr:MULTISPECIES: LPXTG cell wall anchor domain-containing protein [unclassified Paenibacillus]SDD02292.1 LPXTG-motif cell wall anchor domain-containing protein [Paenibacillus sp. cl123]SFW32519.1 LPXTG-motif cell wall anchor domain-containing protein [Paenibacillus sp. UNCCL117]